MLGLFRVALELRGGHPMKKLMMLLLASALGGCCSLGDCPVPARTSRVPLYHARLTGPDFDKAIEIDLIHPDNPVPLARGEGNVGETALWEGTRDGALIMELQAPPELQTFPGTNDAKTPSMGIFYNPVNFDKNAIFSVSAKFQSPKCTNLATSLADCAASWTVTVVAREGGVTDDPNLARIQLSLRSNSTGTNLRVQEGPNDPQTVAIGLPKGKDITGDAYNDIYVNHQPFILKLFVNRKTGSGVGTLTILTSPAQIFSIPFNMGLFTADADRTITTVGAALANNNVPLKMASVEITDFWIDNR